MFKIPFPVQTAGTSIFLSHLIKAGTVCPMKIPTMIKMFKC